MNFDKSFLPKNMPAVTTALDAEFQKNIVDLLKTGNQIRKHYRTGNRTIKTAGPVFDGLADKIAPWSIWKAINHQMMRAAKPLRRNAVVAAARNEGPYLVEWVAHHKTVGFSGIFVYTNNNTDGSDKILELLHDAGEITLIRNECGPGAEPQAKAYEHSLHFLRELREYEWVAYFDLDEFLVPDAKYDHSILPWLDDLRRKRKANLPASIAINWDWYGSNGKIERGPGLIQERFTTRKDYGVLKSMVHLPYVSTMYELHVPDRSASMVNSSLEPCAVNGFALDPPDYGGARLCHYFQKSFEEYAIKKDRGGGIIHGHTERTFDNFFEWDTPPYQGFVTEAPTPVALLSRTKQEMERLYATIPGLTLAEAQSIELQSQVSNRIFAGRINEIYQHFRETISSPWTV